jgi:phage shock protein PspC (stress-responsive transcriptional regulator)
MEVKEEKSKKKLEEKKTSAQDPSAKRLYRSVRERMLGGVAGGVAEYFEVDPVLVRLIFLLLFLAGGAGLLVYIIAWIIIPEDPSQAEFRKSAAAEEPEVSNEPVSSTEESGQVGGGALFLAVALIVVGTMAMVDRLAPDWNVWLYWPAGLILIGLWLIFREL